MQIILLTLVHGYTIRHAVALYLHRTKSIVVFLSLLLTSDRIIVSQQFDNEIHKVILIGFPNRTICVHVDLFLLLISTNLRIFFPYQPFEHYSYSCSLKPSTMKMC